MITGLIETEDELCNLLAKCKQACDRARPGTMLEEFTIIRRLPGNRPPFVSSYMGPFPKAITRSRIGARPPPGQPGPSSESTERTSNGLVDMPPDRSPLSRR